MNTRQAKFVALILAGKTQEAAYKGAGYRCKDKEVAKRAATRLANDPEVAAAIEAGQAKVVEAAVETKIVEVPWLLEKLKGIAENGDKDSARVSAIKLLGDHLGAWTPKPEKPPEPIDVEALADDVKRMLLDALRKAEEAKRAKDAERS